MIGKRVKVHYKNLDGRKRHDARTYVGKIIYKNNKLVVIDTGKYRVSFSANDIACGEAKVDV